MRNLHPKHKKYLWILVILILLLLGFLIYNFVKKPKATKGYAWQVGSPSGPCSVPCGGGFQYANAYCAAVDSGGNIVQTVDDSYCVNNVGPNPGPYKVACNTQSCVWNIGDWSNCSVPCGGGTQTRSVVCSGGDDSACTDSKPTKSQTCNTQSCDWQYGPWSACSVSCGVDGIQTRTATCPGPTGSCTGTPITQQPCSPAPPLCARQYSDWSTCPVPCGQGTQTRTGQCLRNSSAVDPSNCGPEGQ